MRRIDLLCKLGGPFIIALIDGVSTKIAISVNFAMNALSVVVEYYAIAGVRFALPIQEDDTDWFRYIKWNQVSGRQSNTRQMSPNRAAWLPPFKTTGLSRKPSLSPGKEYGSTSSTEHSSRPLRVLCFILLCFRSPAKWSLTSFRSGILRFT